MAETITVTGNIGQEPVSRATAKGDVVEFSVAQNARRRGPDGRWVDSGTTWYRVSAWDRLGVNAAASLRKGQPVIVRGEFTVQEWTGQDGVARHALALKAEAIGHDLRAGTAQFVRTASDRPARSDGSDASTSESPTEVRRPNAAAAQDPAPVDWGSALAADEDAPF